MSTHTDIAQIKVGDQVTITHAEYGTITGRAHKAGLLYLPLGIGHINLTVKGMDRSGWSIVEVVPADAQ